MKRVNIILMGFGNVGKAFLSLIDEKRKLCLMNYGLDILFYAIFRREGAFVNTSFLRGQRY